MHLFRTRGQKSSHLRKITSNFNWHLQMLMQSGFKSKINTKYIYFFKYEYQVNICLNTWYQNIPQSIKQRQNRGFFEKLISILEMCDMSFYCGLFLVDLSIKNWQEDALAIGFFCNVIWQNRLGKCIFRSFFEILLSLYCLISAKFLESRQIFAKEKLGQRSRQVR